MPSTAKSMPPKNCAQSVRNDHENWSARRPSPPASTTSATSTVVKFQPATRAPRRPVVASAVPSDVEVILCPRDAVVRARCSYLYAFRLGRPDPAPLLGRHDRQNDQQQYGVGPAGMD